MPRIISFRIGFLWVAFCLNDYEQATDVKVGLSEQHAQDRTLRSLSRAT